MSALSVRRGSGPSKPIASGVFYHLDSHWTEPIALVEVLNGTPEPDGSRRRYFLCWPCRPRCGPRTKPSRGHSDLGHRSIGPTWKAENASSFTDLGEGGDSSRRERPEPHLPLCIVSNVET